MPASDIIEAQWVAERRGLDRFRTDQPPHSILNRGIEREVLPIAQRYGMGILDQIDEIVPPGTDVGTLDQAYLPPALQNPSLRRRPVNERAAA